MPYNLEDLIIWWLLKTGKDYMVTGKSNSITNVFVVHDEISFDVSYYERGVPLVDSFTTSHTVMLLEYINSLYITR